MISFSFVVMRIEQYISQLLYRYQCVTVPGFGAFLTENRPAQLVEETHTFYPPKKVVLFNFHLKNNDGLLANQLAHGEKISYEQAVTLLENEVATWKIALQKNEAISLKNIGKLSLNSEKNIVFEPIDQLNYAMTSFGLTSFVSPRIKREVYKEEVEKIEEKAPIVFTPERRATPWLKYAAIFAFSIGIAGYFGNQWHQTKIASETLLVEKAVQQKVENKIQEATFFIENPLPSVSLTIKEEKTERHYHVVAGAYKENNNAERALQSLLKLGYEAKIISPNKYGLHPVLYGSYASLEDAKTALQTIKQAHNKEAWMLVLDLEN